MKKIVIAGGGVSGLVARYYLSKKFLDAEIVLFERSGRLGGCIESIHESYFFETGPRTFKLSRSAALLQLIRELGLEEEIIYSDKAAEKRFLWKDQKLHLVPTRPLGLLTSTIMRPMLFGLLKEWRQPTSSEGDESVATFVTRRLGKYAAETFFDPLATGIYGGDIDQLSISACFPQLKGMEREYGSLTKAFFKQKKEKKPHGLFTLRGGVITLVERLTSKGRGPIHLNTPLESLDGEKIILATSAYATARFFKGDPVAENFFKQLTSVPLTVINFAFQKKALKQRGFGYLIPRSEGEKILGVVFDSAIFPSQSSQDETRLTVMMREGGVEEAMDALRRHLKVDQIPLYAHTKVYPHVLPQYTVKHLARVQAFEAHLKQNYPQVTCIGNYLHGVSLTDCIELASSLDRDI